jgi:hypothetical protein
MNGAPALLSSSVTSRKRHEWKQGHTLNRGNKGQELEHRIAVPLPRTCLAPASAAACAASANTASKAKFRTNLRIHIRFLLIVNLAQLATQRTSAPRVATSSGLPRWCGPGMNLSQLGFSGVWVYESANRRLNYRPNCLGPQRLPWPAAKHAQPFGQKSPLTGSHTPPQ